MQHTSFYIREKAFTAHHFFFFLFFFFFFLWFIHPASLVVKLVAEFMKEQDAEKENL